jgi:flagellar protein FliL
MAGKTEGGEEKAKGGKSRLVIGAVVAVVAVVLLKVFVLGGGGKAAAESAGGAVTTSTVAGPVVTLEPITLNIAGGRFLKVGLSFQLSGKHTGEDKAKDGDDPTKGYAKAVDIAIATLGGRSFDDLATPEAREKVKIELVDKLEHAYPDEIEGIYFTQFVMQ